MNGGGHQSAATRPGATPNFNCITTRMWKYYLNGVLAAQAPGFSTQYFETNIAAASATLKPGRNEPAVHCHQTTGGQYIDVGIVILHEPTK